MVIQVHPAQVEVLRQRARELDLSSTCEIQVMADAALVLGDCLIESELGLVDARLETQFAVIERVLLRGAR